MDIVFLIIGFFVIIKASDMLVSGSVNLAKFLKIPTIVIGLTVIAIATGVPEIAISISSSLKGSNGLLLGNLIGSNMFNVLFILGLIAVIRPLYIKKEIIFKNYVYAIFSCIVLLVVSLDSFLGDNSINLITRSEGVLLLLFAFLFLYTTVLDATFNSKTKIEITKFRFKDVVYIILGVILIALSADVIVNSSVNISSYLGVSEDLIGLTVIAIGTNLPELVTSIVAVKKGESDIAIGNLIGTNILNIFLILGMSSCINPIVISFNTLIDIILLGITSLIVYIFIRRKRDINRFEGITMIILYIIYIVYVVIR